MFGWIKRIGQKRRDAERAIFRFHDGERVRYVDPVVAYQRIEDKLGTEWPQLLKTLATPIPPAPLLADGTPVDMGRISAIHRDAQTKASERIAEVACEAFGVQPIQDDGKGLTQSERIALTARFLVYLGEMIERARPFVNSPEPTG